MTYITGLRDPFEAFVAFSGRHFWFRIAGRADAAARNCESHHDMTDSA